MIPCLFCGSITAPQHRELPLCKSRRKCRRRCRAQILMRP